MGDIADMHVEAWAAGLDPSEMDGADWAEFNSDNDAEPLTEQEAADWFAASMRCFPMVDLAEAANEGEAPADTLCRLFPTITKDQATAFFAVVEAIGGLPEGTA